MVRETLKAWRTRAKLTQEQLADALGIDRTTVNRYEAGTIAMTAQRVYAVASACGVDDAEISSALLSLASDQPGLPASER